MNENKKIKFAICAQKDEGIRLVNIWAKLSVFLNSIFPQNNIIWKIVTSESELYEVRQKGKNDKKQAQN